MSKAELEQIDAMIRSAKATQAQQKILELIEGGVAPTALLTVASLARRAGLCNVALKLLFPVVRPNKKRLRPATPEDVAEYGASLQRIGSISEAMYYLESVDPAVVPSAFLFRAFGHMKEWDYSAALPLLRSYVRVPTIGSYERLTGKTNLVSVLIFENCLGEAKSLLSEILEEGSGLLHAISLRYRGNIEFRRGDYEQAVHLFEISEQALAPFGGLELYFAKKWKALSKMFLLKNAGEIVEVRRLALELRHWESLRDIDFHQAVMERNTERLHHIYFGTPHAHYKEHLKKTVPSYSPLDRYDLKLGKLEVKHRVKVSIANEERTKKDDFLKNGHSLQRLYLTLLSDFYRPLSLMNLFERIFDGDSYVPGSAEPRVHQAIKRLRLWFTENDIPLGIIVDGGDYRLEATKPVTIPIEIAQGVHPSFFARLNTLKLKFDASFSLKEAAESLGIARRTASDFILKAVKEGRLVRSGSGSSTRYEFKDVSSVVSKAA